MLTEKQYSATIRQHILKLVVESGYGFLGSCFSCVEILAAFTRFAPPKLKVPLSKIILSKGHAVPTLYAMLACESSTPLDYKKYSKFNSQLEGHPNALLNKDMAVTTGSLGLGLAVAIGEAKKALLDGCPAPKLVIVGDGELQEGLVWESLQAARRLNLGNLIVVLDNNKMQSVGQTSEWFYPSQLFKAAGWQTTRADGHSIQSLLSAAAEFNFDTPFAIIADTKRGWGFEGYPTEARMSWMPDTAQLESNLLRLAAEANEHPG